MREKPTDYQHQQIESKWRQLWQKNQTFQVDLKAADQPYYNLMMFPYPSAEGLHVGNMYAFTGSDIWGRFIRMQGKQVFEPIGLDGFGIHSENYAIKVGRHPAKQAKISEQNFYRQLAMIGNQFSWDQALETYDPNYYQWTQWIFVQLFKAGLAYRDKFLVNWCPSCKTVLADEQVIQGQCERCDAQVKQRKLNQWFFRITEYADRLLANLKKIDWTPKVKIAQRNWIGRNQGINISYPVVDEEGQPVKDEEGQPVTVSCFTTRPDTNYGASFVVLAPEHPKIEQITSKDNKKAVSSYIKRVIKKTKEQRIADAGEKTGRFTGRYCLNRLTNQKMPVWVSDFVLMEVGTGAVVGVPGHDKRDFQFAQQFDLPIIRVVVGPDGDQSKITRIDQVQEEEGTMVNSGILNGLEIDQATKKIIKYIEEQGWGEKTVDYHLRDWLISRQRYWGPPIPMIYCPACAKKGRSWFTTKEAEKWQQDHQLKDQALNQNPAGWYPVPEKDLPVKLPEVEDWRPKGTGRGPLAELTDWLKTTCPECGGPAKRETDVSDTFLDSAWYFLRYPSGSSTEQAWDRELTRKWLPVDMYIGGAEHSVLHLLYSRFLTMVFYDLGYLEFEEPFTKFRAHGLIIKDGAKMSKSKGNIINPDEYIEKYGADTLRCYLMFLGPLSQGGDFRDTGIAGMHRFLSRVWQLAAGHLKDQANGLVEPPAGQAKEDQEFWRHQTIKRVEKDIQRLKYNTALAALMEYLNFLQTQDQISRASLKTLILLLAPFAPHLTEELWQQYQGRKVKTKTKFKASDSVHHQGWPQYEPAKLKKDQLEIVVQVNGQKRAVITLGATTAEFASQSAKKKALTKVKKLTKIKRYLKDKKIKRTIFVKGKLINLVVG